ncbi:hypothetical protein BDV93DRAFT_510658 [Ceratobasidium sp. AG-I]|nr:hypothetical protein BDV93DRAFT_510658 [Ceratobasidium sp. AG-I]
MAYFMSPPLQNNTSLAWDRPRRVNIPVLAQAQQECQFQGELEYKSALAAFFLRKVATCDAGDLRADYERGDIDIDALRKAAEDPTANKEPKVHNSTEPQNVSSGGEKGKACVNDSVTESQVDTVYKGITVNNVSHSLQSRHAVAAAKQAQVQANRNSCGPLLARTDMSTIYPGQGKPLPNAPLSRPWPSAGNQLTNTRVIKPGQPTCPLPPTSEPCMPTGQVPVACPAAQFTVAHPSTRDAASPAPWVVKVLVPETQEIQERRHKSQDNLNQAPPPRTRAPAPVNAKPQDPTVRQSNKRTDAQYTPINMGSRPPNHSKPNAPRPEAPQPDQRRNRVAIPQDRPIEDEFDTRDAGNYNNFDGIGNDKQGAIENIDNGNQGGNNAATTHADTKVPKPACIKSHKPETQDTLHLMVEIALAYIVGAGTYNHPISGLNPTMCEEVASKAWAMACEQTKRDFPILPTHLKVLDAHVTTSHMRTKTVLKPEIDKFFGFDVDKPANNASLSKELLMDGFHQGDWKNNRLDFCGEYLRRACHAVAFGSTDSYVADHPMAFTPFPMAFVAFVCSIRAGSALRVAHRGYTPIIGITAHHLTNDPHLPQCSRWHRRALNYAVLMSS